MINTAVRIVAGGLAVALALTAPSLAQGKKPGDLPQPGRIAAGSGAEAVAPDRDLIAACAALVADPEDQTRPAGLAGVAFGEIDPAPAVAACEAAHDTAPGDARTTFHLARAFTAAGDFTRAEPLFRQAAGAGYAAAAYRLGRAWLDPDALGEDWGIAVPYLVQAAEADLPGAQFELAWSYLKGLGQPADIEAAIRWYARAAEAEHVPSQYELGWVYFEGFAGAPDYERAYYWYSRAAENGNRIALNDLGYMYEKGLFVAQDLDRARDYYRQAAERGLASAQTNLGYLYQDGRGVAQDFAEAARWYRMAADQGDPRGKLDLGALYYKGQGVAQDTFRAFQLFEEARAGGDKRAYIYLGNLFEYDAERADPARAAGYYVEALRNGNDWALQRPADEWTRAAALAMQRQLRDLGVYEGLIDGVMGEGSRAAMRRLLGS